MSMSGTCKKWGDSPKYILGLRESIFNLRHFWLALSIWDVFFRYYIFYLFFSLSLCSLLSEMLCQVTVNDILLYITFAASVVVIGLL